MHDQEQIKRDCSRYKKEYANTETHTQHYVILCQPLSLVHPKSGFDLTNVTILSVCNKVHHPLFPPSSPFVLSPCQTITCFFKLSVQQFYLFIHFAPLQPVHLAVCPTIASIQPFCPTQSSTSCASQSIQPLAQYQRLIQPLCSSLTSPFSLYMTHYNQFIYPVCSTITNQLRLSVPLKPVHFTFFGLGSQFRLSESIKPSSMIHHNLIYPVCHTITVPLPSLSHYNQSNQTSLFHYKQSSQPFCPAVTIRVKYLASYMMPFHGQYSNYRNHH